MSNFLFNEGLTYAEPKDDPLYSYFKEEEQEISTEPPFSLHSESPAYNTNYYQYPYLHPEEQSYTQSYMSPQVGMHSTNSKQIVKDFPEPPKMGNNSKKIKREVAKKRTQLKQGTKPCQAKDFENCTDDMLAEALNNPNLDEKTSKKLKQMIRNRISAQNSRDRKKAYVANMEKTNQLLKMQNSQLIQEITVLKEANKMLITEKEELMKKLQNDNNFCSHCAHNNVLTPSTNTHSTTHSSDEALTIPHSEELHFDDYITRGDGGSSPLFNRLFSGRSFLSYTLTVATVLSLVLLVNVNGPNGQAGTLTELKPQKFFVVSPMQNVTETKEIAPVMTEQPAINLNAMLAAALKSPFLQNIYDLKNQFNEQAMVAFFKHLKLNEKMAPCVENIQPYTKLEPVEKIEIESESHPIVEYGFLNRALKSRSEMQRKDLAALGEFDNQTVRKNRFSTLFCPAGFEFFDSEQDEVVKKPSNMESQNVLDSEYLQFYIPKRQVTGIYKNKTSNDLVLSPEVNTADENVILEVWCKVFHVRELSATIDL